MNFDKFYKSEQINLLIFEEINEFKNDYENRVMYLSLQEAVVELKPKRQWLADTYSLLKHCDTSEFTDQHSYLSRWFCFTFAPLSTLVREIDFLILDETLPEPDIKYEDWANDALHLLRANWGKPENFQIKNFEAWALYDAEVKPLEHIKPIKGSCFEEAERIASNWCFLRKHGAKWDQNWRELIHIYNAFAAHYEPIATALDERLIKKYPELKRWSKDWVREIPDRENWENGLTLCRLHKNEPRILIKEMSDGSERHCSDTEFVEYLRNKETKTYSNLTPPNTTTESMTTSKLAILEAGFAGIKEIKRPAEKRLALLDLSKQLQLPQGELSKLIQELSFEKSQLNNQFETFDSVMSADIDQELIVDKLIMSGTISMVAAESGTGKSSLIYQIMESVSTGSPLFDMFPTKQCNVHVIQVDESYVNARRKWQRMQLKPDPSKVSFCWEWSPTQMEELEQKIVTKNIGLCFMDSFGKLFGASGDMNTIEAGYYMYELNNLAAKTGCAFVVAHHLKKDQSKHKKDQPRIPTLGDFFGSGYIIAGVRDAWGLWQKGEDTDGTPLYGLRYLKDNSGLIDKGWTFNLSGCLESQRFHLLGNKGGLDELEERKNIRSKLQLLLKSRTPDWLSVEQLHDGICTKKTFTGMGDKVDIKSVKKELLGLVDDAARTGIERTAVKSECRGRPRYKYRFVC